MWQTLYGDHGRQGHPPVAIVFTKQVGPEAMMNRMTAIRDLSTECWRGHWQDGTLYGSGVKDGFRRYDDTVPVTTLPPPTGARTPRAHLVALRAFLVGDPRSGSGQPGRLPGVLRPR
ncbi:hypothetical protein [Streptomyces agglomeratus]|uniref:hypothetical protein n=1 Tax=Streptomyces agglomeratus TaxID=285458 RepID=UPI001F0B5331|nr:hypothetical protein [Streptomyces agglomeratus]